jgi:hypothetical protein
MSATAVLRELIDAGIIVDAVDGRIRCRHAAGALSARLAARVREHRDEILTLLTEPGALRTALPTASVDAEPMMDDDAAQEIINMLPGLISCQACGFERNTEIEVCPVCHPAPWLPAGYLAATVCSVLGPCQRHSSADPCRASAIGNSALTPVCREMVP